MHGLPSGDPPKEAWPEAEDRLKEIDPKVAEAIQEVGGPPMIQVVTDPFEALARGIIHQQLGAETARSIAQKIEDDEGNFPSPGDILENGPDSLQQAGLPETRARQIFDLARSVVRRDIDLEALREMENDDIVDELTEIPGVGPWTADMFLVFHLERPDVLLAGDVSLQNAVQEFYDLEERPSEEELREIAEDWRPYRSAAAWYIWKVTGGFASGFSEPQ